MSDRPIDTFELVGDLDALPDAFFDALAELLLSIDAVGGSMPDMDQAESGRPITTAGTLRTPVADALRHTGQLLTAGNIQELLP